MRCFHRHGRRHGRHGRRHGRHGRCHGRHGRVQLQSMKQDASRAMHPPESLAAPHPWQVCTPLAGACKAPPPQNRLSDHAQTCSVSLTHWSNSRGRHRSTQYNAPCWRGGGSNMANVGLTQWISRGGVRANPPPQTAHVHQGAFLGGCTGRTLK